MELIKSDPEIMSGTPCFSGTRVPVKSLFDWLAGGYTIEYFLDQFPSVTREQVLGVLQESQLRLTQKAEPARA
jgi:uncharacterized protein (DUF433 family)